MAPKSRKRNESPPPPRDPDGMFAGMFVLFIEKGVLKRRLEVWKLKLFQMGATEEDTFSKRLTHIFANDSVSLLEQLGRHQLSRFKGNVLRYQWLEDSLKLGEKVSKDPYVLPLDTGVESLKNSSVNKISESANGKNSTGNEISPRSANRKDSMGDETSHHKKIKTSPKNSKTAIAEDREKIIKNALSKTPSSGSNSDESFSSLSPEVHMPVVPNVQDKNVGYSESNLHYKPPDLNKNITEIFGKLINIYRALGDDRRSFSYYKAIPVIEKLPFKIESVEQVKHLPAIGKSMQDHIQEIVSTGKLSKLEHFETDEKVRTISLFGEVWGIGPATALKLYDKGHRTLDDLKNEPSLTHAQKLGLKYFADIKTRIPRHEVQEMEFLLQKAADNVLPGMVVLCGGSYRRGKASCGDMDIVITHPDGKSHIGFLPKYVKHLKDMNFLKEDLVFSIHSEEGTDSGVDTYFGLCTYPGRQLRHRIDLKVYPRDIYAFGLIHWTGNDVVNRSESFNMDLLRVMKFEKLKLRLRLLAESKGFRLDDTGLFPATQSSGGKRGTRASASLKFDTEKEVFDFLGFPWLEPHERNL